MGISSGWRHVWICYLHCWRFVSEIHQAPVKFWKAFDLVDRQTYYFHETYETRISWFMIYANTLVHYGLKVVFVCLPITLSHHHYHHHHHHHHHHHCRRRRCRRRRRRRHHHRNHNQIESMNHYLVFTVISCYAPMIKPSTHSDAWAEKSLGWIIKACWARRFLISWVSVSEGKRVQHCLWHAIQSLSIRTSLPERKLGEWNTELICENCLFDHHLCDYNALWENVYVQPWRTVYALTWVLFLFISVAASLLGKSSPN